MLENCKYDKIKLLHELSSIAWFIEKHAKINAKNNGQIDCYNLYQSILLDLEKQINKIQAIEDK